MDPFYALLFFYATYGFIAFILLRALYQEIGQLFGYSPPLPRWYNKPEVDEEKWWWLDHQKKFLENEINPATGFVMTSDSLDAEGNPYGTNFSEDD